MAEPSQTTAKLGFPYPAPTQSPADVPLFIQRLAEAVEKRVIGVFATTSARDTAWTAPTEGQFAFITDGAGALTFHNGSTWVQLYPSAEPKVTSSNAAPSGGTNGDVHFQY